jgi:hypothetical protein
MKYNSVLRLILFGFICAFIAASCTKEGPMGPAGADGKDGANGIDGTNGSDGRDGVDGQVTCLVCHSGTNMEQKQAEFSMSVHRAGLVAVDYAGGRASCARCHSHEGFTQYAVFDNVLGDITNPTAWKCNTCHGLHESFEGTDYALRLSDPINPIYDETTTMDLKGNSNLCANCHQSRRAEPNIDAPGDTYKITSTHYGPHHGAQANVVAGVGFAEVAGPVGYPEAGSSNHLNMASCTGCHMAPYSYSTEQKQGQGGHTWQPSLASCNTCHNADSKDFNYGGVQTEVHEKLVALRDRLIELGVVAGSEEEGFHPVVGEYPMAQARAFFNWVGLEEDRSLGVHNPKYVKALLTNSLDALKDF